MRQQLAHVSMRSMRAFSLSLAGFLLTSILSAQTPQGPQILVSNRPDFPFVSKMATAANGKFVVVWQSETSTGPYRLWLRRFDANGKPRSGEALVSVSHPPGADQTYPEIAMAAGGSFMVVWQAGTIPRRTVVYGRLFAESGLPLGPSFRLNPGGQDLFEVHPAIAVSPDGSFVTAWTSGPSPYAGDDAILFRHFAANGKPLGPVQVVAPAAEESWQDKPRVAVSGSGSGSGDYLISWMAAAGSFGNFQLLAQRFDAEDHPLGEQLNATQGHGLFNTDYSFAVAMTGTGESLFLWTSPTSILGQRIAADGTRLGDSFLIHEFSGLVGEPPPGIALLPGGGYVVVWGSLSSIAATITSTIFGQSLSSDGVVQGPSVQINASGLGFDPAVGLTLNGGGFVTWTYSQGHSDRIMIRRLAPPE